MNSTSGQGTRRSSPFARVLNYIQRRGGKDANRRPFSGAAAHGFAQVADAVLWLAVLPLITRSVPLTIFAQFTFFRLAIPILRVFLDLGCGTASIHRYAHERDPATLRALVPTLWQSRLVLSAIVATIAWATAGHTSSDVATSLYVGGVALVFDSVFFANAESLRAQKRHNAVGAAVVSGAVARTAAFAVVFLRDSATLQDLLIVVTIGYAASLISTIVSLGRQLRGTFNWHLYRSLLTLGGPASAYYMTRVASDLDRYIVALRSHVDQAGLFQLANVPSGFIDPIENAASLASEPHIYATPPEKQRLVLSQMFCYAAFVYISLASALALLAPELVAILAPAGYYGAMVALPMVILGRATSAITRILCLGAGARGNTRIWMRVGVLELVCSLGLMYLLVPSFGLLGASFGRFLAGATGVTIAYFSIRPLLDIRLPVIRLMAFAAGVAGVALCTATSAINPPMTIAPRLVLILVAIAGAAWISGAWRELARSRGESARD